MTPCTSTIGRPCLGLAQGGLKSGRHSQRGPRRQVVPCAAAGAADVDLKALLRESLEAAPKKPLALDPVEAAPPAGPVPDLPGTEILPSALPTASAAEALPEPTQGFDFDAWQAATTAAKAAKTAAGSAGPREIKPLPEVKLPEVSLDLDSLTSGTSAALSQASEATAKAADAVTGAASALTQGVGGFASALKSGLGGATSALKEGVGSTVGGATSTLTKEVGGATSAITGGVNQATEAASSAAAAATSAVSGLTNRVTSVFEDETAIIKSNLDSALGGVQSGVAAVEQAVGGAVSGVYEQVPEPVKDALSAASSVAVSAASAAAANPQLTAVATGVAVGVPTILIWQAIFGGYSGQLSPQEALDLLQGGDALLVDVRTEAQRLEKGIPELRRGALGKGAAVPPVQLLPSLARRMKSADGLALDIQAALIASLGKVGAGTKVIVMDNQGERAKTVARAVAAAGARAYVLRGGFKAWQAAGLKVREGATEYDASVADALADEVDVIAEQTMKVVGNLKEPKNAVIVVAAVSALGLAAYNLHTVLQFLGVLGLEWSLYQKYSEYDSPQEALEDLGRMFSKASGAVSGAAALLPKSSSGASGGGNKPAAGSSGQQ